MSAVRFSSPVPNYGGDKGRVSVVRVASADLTCSSGPYAMHQMTWPIRTCWFTILLISVCHQMHYGGKPCKIQDIIVISTRTLSSP